MACAVCNGSGRLLADVCPLCDGETASNGAAPAKSKGKVGQLSLRSSFGSTCACSTCGSDDASAEQARAEYSKPQAAFWRHRWRVKKPGAAWTLSGHSRALVRTGFVIEELRAFLDAGVAWKTPNPMPSVICVTHTHIDHCNALPMLLRTPANPVILAPDAHMAGLKEMASMTWSVKRPWWEPAKEQPAFPMPDDDREKPGTHAIDACGLVTGDGNDKHQRWVPVRPGHCLDISQSGGWSVSVVKCFHTIEDVGYVLCENGTLRVGVDDEAELEYRQILAAIEAGDKKAGRAIGMMKKNGRIREVVKRVPRLAFLCDTTIQVFGACEQCRAGAECPYGQNDYLVRCPPAEALEEQVRMIFDCSTIVVECSFVAIGMDEEQAEKEAIKRGHISWSQLRPLVEAHPDIEFVLVHFSERYTDAELRSFFATASTAGGALPNVLLWLDEGLSRGEQAGKVDGLD